MTTVYTRAGLGHALTWQNMDDNINNLNTAKIESISQDLTPTLGADLNVNGKSIVSSSNGNINITPNGTGAVKLSQIQYPKTDGTNGQVLVTNGAGVLSFATITSGSSALSSLTDVSLSSPSSGQVLKYNGTVWANSTDLGLTAISQDLTPSLGANLDTKSFTISSSTGNVLINDIVTLNGTLYNTAAGLTSSAPGQLVWNDTEGTLEFQLKGGNVTLQVGQEQVQYVLNNTGGALTDGTVVYVTGSSGTRLTIDTATATTEATSANTIGILTENIANNQSGFMTTNGLVHGVNTLGMTEGSALWLSTTAGLYTTTRPVAPNHAVFLGWVIRAHQTQGIIFVHVQNGYELDELHNVSITSPTTGQVMKYNSTTGVWSNAAETDPVFTASPAYGITGTSITNWNTAYGWGNHASAGYQSALVSGTNIKTINSGSILGSGDLALQTVLVSGTSIKTVNSTSLLGSGDVAVQPTLVSGTNIKTVNGTTLLGAGNIVISSGTGLGSLTAYKADGSQDDLPVNATTTLNQLTINQELLLKKDSLIAIETTGNYGWRDITSDIVLRGSGAQNPSWGTIRDGLSGYLFSATAMQECWVTFHINHDYALGTAIYLHAHWVNPGTSTGVVRFGFEYSIAKGHQQEIFPATTIVYKEQACTGQYYHMVAEIDTGITSTSLEPDSLVMVRIFRDGAHANDTCTNAIAIVTSDIHYQTNRFATKNKAPAFNV